MKKKLFLAISLVCFLISGCYLSRYPIDVPPVKKIDTRLFGKWKGDRDNSTYTLTKKDDYQYRISVKEKKKRKKDIYTGFLSEINSVLFLNVYYVEDSVKGYVFMKILNINSSSDSITFTEVYDSAMQYRNSALEVRNYIKDRIDSPGFYSDTAHFYRIR